MYIYIYIYIYIPISSPHESWFTQCLLVGSFLKHVFWFFQRSPPFGKTILTFKKALVGAKVPLHTEDLLTALLLSPTFVPVSGALWTGRYGKTMETSHTLLFVSFCLNFNRLAAPSLPSPCRQEPPQRYQEDPSAGAAQMLLSRKVSPSAVPYGFYAANHGFLRCRWDVHPIQEVV